jgi:hypothetical protein
MKSKFGKRMADTSVFIINGTWTLIIASMEGIWTSTLTYAIRVM